MAHIEEGLWIADRVGRVYEKHKGEDLSGSVLHLGSPSLSMPASICMLDM